MLQTWSRSVRLDGRFRVGEREFTALAKLMWVVSAEDSRDRCCKERGSPIVFITGISFGERPGDNEHEFNRSRAPTTSSTDVRTGTRRVCGADGTLAKSTDAVFEAYSSSPSFSSLLLSLSTGAVAASIAAISSAESSTAFLATVGPNMLNIARRGCFHSQIDCKSNPSTYLQSILLPSRKLDDATKVMNLKADLPA